MEHPLPEWLACVAYRGGFRLSGVSLACLCNFHTEAELHVCLDFRPIALDMSCVHTLVALHGEAPIQFPMPQDPPPWRPVQTAVQRSIPICGSTLCTIHPKQSADLLMQPQSQ